jgi:hypothetical protein
MIVRATEFGRRVELVGGKTRWCITIALGVLLAGTLTLFRAEVRGATVQVAPAHPAIGASAPPESLTSLAVMPSTPADGILSMIIPPGAAADQQAGGRGYEMPSVISLTIGDTIVIRNDDDAPHMILYTFLMPGETDERTFTETGSEVYSSGCGLHGASILNFTSIFVSEPGTNASSI